MKKTRHKTLLNAKKCKNANMFIYGCDGEYTLGFHTYPYFFIVPQYTKNN